MDQRRAAMGEEAAVEKEAEVSSIERRAVRRRRIVKRGEELELKLDLGQSCPGSWKIITQVQEYLINGLV